MPAELVPRISPWRRELLRNAGFFYLAVAIAIIARGSETLAWMRVRRIDLQVALVEREWRGLSPLLEQVRSRMERAYRLAELEGPPSVFRNESDLSRAAREDVARITGRPLAEIEAEIKRARSIDNRLWYLSWDRGFAAPHEPEAALAIRYSGKTKAALYQLVSEWTQSSKNPTRDALTLLEPTRGTVAWLRAAEWHGRNLELARDFSGMRQVFQQAAEALQALPPETVEPPQRLAILRGVTDSQRYVGGVPREGEALARQCLAEAEKLLGSEHPETLRAAESLLLQLRRGRHTGESLQLCERLLAASTRQLGEEHLDTLSLQAALAEEYWRSPDHAAAARERRRVFAGRERVLGSDHPVTRATLSKLRSALGFASQGAERTALDRAVLADRERRLGADHPETLEALDDLAGALPQSDRAEALELHRRAAAAHERLHGPGHPATLRSLTACAHEHFLLKQLDDAEALHRRVLEAYERLRGADAPETIRSLTSLVNVLRTAGRHADAEPLQRRKLEALERRPGKDSRDNVLEAVQELAQLLTAQGWDAEAEPLLRHTIAEDETADQRSDSSSDGLSRAAHRLIQTRSALAGVLRQQGRLDEAEQLLRKVVATHEGKATMWEFTSKLKLATFLHDRGAEAEAETLLRWCLDRMAQRRSARRFRPDVDAVFRLAQIEEKKGSKAEAARWARQAAEFAREALPPDDSLRQSAETMAARLGAKPGQ